MNSRVVQRVTRGPQIGTPYCLILPELRSKLLHRGIDIADSVCRIGTPSMT